MIEKHMVHYKMEFPATTEFMKRFPNKLCPVGSADDIFNIDFGFPSFDLRAGPNISF